MRQNMYLITIKTPEKTIDISFEGTLEQAKKMAVTLSQKDGVLAQNDIKVDQIYKILISDEKESEPLSIWETK
jgi:hypothetical protein